MKKFLMLITVMLCILCGAFAACGGQNAPHVHDFTDYVYNNDATCTKDGTETGKCSCGETDTRTKERTALGHDMQTVEAQAPTCTSVGWEQHKACSRCGEKENYTEKQAFGHEYQDDFCIRCHEQKPSNGLLYILTDDGKSYMAAGLGSCQDKDIVIASFYNEKPVTAIGMKAFENVEITSVTMPTTIVKIEDNAFNGCRRLESITIGNTVTSIGKNAFAYCNNLKEVHISDLAAWCEIEFKNAYANPLSCAHHLFMDDKEITNLEIPNSLISIKFGAFFGCSGLTSVTIPDSVKSIEQSAFHGCSGLTEITIPKSVKSIGGSVFCECSGLTSVIIPDSVILLGFYVFSNCSALTSVTIGNNVMSIGVGVFSGCSALTSVTIGSSVSAIGKMAFYGCKNLISVIIPDEVATIGAEAFSGCSGLTSVTIGDGVLLIGHGAFSGCSGLTSVTIPDSVVQIQEYAFGDCNGLTSITLGSGVTSIGKATFKNCINLQSVIFRDPNGWNCYGSEMSETLLQDFATAAVYLSKTYSDYVWVKIK